MNQLLPGFRARAVLVALISGLVAVAGIGNLPPASAAPGAQISGTVTDDNGAPVKGIHVSVLSFVPAEGAWQSVGEATTKNDGSYVARKLDPGTYQVFFGSSGDYVDEYYDDEVLLEEAADVVVGEGETITGIDAALTRTGEISGVVTDEEGVPLADVDVTLMTFNNEGDFWETWGGTFTRPDGSYLLAGARPGDWKVEFADSTGAHATEYYDDHEFIWDADDVRVLPGETTTGVDAQLAAGGHFTGTVTGPEGEVIEGLSIQPARLVGGDWQAIGDFGFGTDAEGNFDIGGMLAGTYRFDFTDRDGNYLYEVYDDVTSLDEATLVELAEGASVALNDVVLDRASRLEGTVTDEEGNPLEGVDVIAWHPAGDGHLEIAADTETETDGTYTIGGLRDDGYRVQFTSGDGQHALEYYDDVFSIDDATLVELDPGETASGVDAELAVAAHIEGTVTDTAGEPVEAGVFGWRQHGDHWDDIGFAVSDLETGAYDMDGLAPGTYRLEFFSFGELDAQEFWDDQPSLELAQDVVVTEKGQVLTGYDAVLEDGQYPSEVENLTPPAISGAPVVGNTLAASNGTWNLDITGFHYQWFAGDKPVGGDAPTYTPASGDVTKAITVTVVGSVAGVGSAAATSAATAPVTQLEVRNLKRPVIKGTVVVGERVRVTAGRWTPAGVALTYKWFVGDKRIVGADGRKLLVKHKWLGQRLRAKVVAKANGYLKAVVLTKRSARIQP